MLQLLPGCVRNPARLRSSPLIPLAALICVGAFAFVSRIAAAENEKVTPDERQRGFRARTLLAKPRATLNEVERAEASARLRLVRTHARLGGIRMLETDGTEDVKDIIERLQASGLYDYVELDYIRTASVTPNDARFASDQWSLQNSGQSGGTVGADIKAAAAWDIQRDAPNVIVAVIDSGVRLNHEDIAANLWVNNAETASNAAIDEDGNGYINDVHGINAFVARTSNRSGDPTDDDGHGTHVAGIIGAVGDNGVGVAGVAWKVQIMALKFLGPNGGSVSGSIACIDYAIAKGAHIINASYGSSAFSQAEFDAIKRARDAGIVFVAAAGNDNQEITEFPSYPAAYRLDNIVAVASTTRQDRLASYSSFSSGIVELAAPGSSILSLGYTQSAPYVTLSGTSMAAPHVAGAMALLKQKFPRENYRALMNRLLGAVDVLPALDHRVHTNGRLNLVRALNSTHSRPFNDDFASRATITGSGNSVRTSNQFATVEGDEPDHGVAGATGSLWWSWTAPDGTGRVTINTAGSGIDTVLAVYRGSTAGALQRVAFNDNAEANLTTSSVTFESTGGTTYAIAVAAKGSAEGLITFELNTAPMNDAFAAARELKGPSVVVEANTARATSETSEPRIRTASGTAIGSGKTLWFKWLAPQTRSYQISAYGKSTDPVLALFTGASLAALSQVASDDDSGPSTDSLIRFTATAGVTYYICVDSYFSTGALTLSIADAAWQYVGESEFDASPALAADGTLYAVESDGLVHAVRPDGTRKWRSTVIYTEVGYVIGGSLTVAPDGTIYACDDFGVVYAMEPTSGALKWSYETGDVIWAAPALAADGTLYVKSDDGQLYALRPDGTLKWKFAVPGDTYASPVIAADGTIYIGSDKDSALYALTPEGVEKWRAPLGSSIYASPALGADGTIYVGNYDGRFFAIRPNGTVRWQFDTGSPLSGSAAIGADGTVYFGSYDKKLYALDGATGAKRWDYATGETIRSTAPVIADDGTIYIGSDDRFIHALNSDGTLLRTYATTGAILGAPILAAGRLYVASTDSKLYAFDTGNNIAGSPWPMHRHNARRIARSADLPGIPTILTQPVAPTNVVPGTSAQIAVSANVQGGGALTYQWYFNDSLIVGALASALHLPSVQGLNAGSYRVVVTGPGGSVISTATTLTVAAATSTTSRLINLAVRTTAGSGDRVLFVGLTVGGANTSGPKPLLIRAVGPTLSRFGVTGLLTDPRLELFSSGINVPIASNDNWGGDATIATVTPQVGAFTLAANDSKDAALFSTRPGGGYTAQVSSATAGNGIALAEIYDATDAGAFTATTPRLINVSARTQVGTGGNILIAGFAISGTGSKTVLVRGIGPTLTGFGVTGVLANPKLELFATGNTTPISTNDDWGAATNAGQVAVAATNVGAFPLALESRDAVLLVTLPPGGYTAQVSGVNNTTGAALVEVYEVP